MKCFNRFSLLHGNYIYNSDHICGNRPCQKMYFVTELGHNLGYIEIDTYKNESQRLHKLATLGFVEFNIYYKLPINNTSNELWDKFIKYKVCIRCRNKHITTKFKPYCSKCYKCVKDCNHMGMKLQISNTFRNELRSKLSWIGNFCVPFVD